MVVELPNATTSESAEAIKDIHRLLCSTRVLAARSTAGEISVVLPRSLGAVEERAIGGDSPCLLQVSA